jgi:hypothetical protein
VYITDSCKVESDASMDDSQDGCVGGTGGPACLTEFAFRLYDSVPNGQEAQTSTT